MISSKAAISLLGGLLLLAVFMANVLNSIATDHNFYVENQDQGENFTKYLSEKYGRITDTTKNILWFMQISDIHISIFRDPSRISQFQQFCDNTVKEIKPSVVLATGDLTDAKAKDNLGSSQVKTEWVYYYNIIKESGVTDNITWLDIRGNHDNFNIRTINSEENYFRKYSVQGAYNPKSYVHVENKNGINVAFLGVDACPDPGLRRPFNFVGLLNKDEQQHILSLQAEAASKSDHIVWFGHYPTSCILSLDNDSEKLNIRDLIGKDFGSQVYVCGHLHAMGGLVREMYTRQRKGYLELELEDWKDNRMYRLAAIDHGIFSFVDQKHNMWPVILVTNPKHAQFVITGREPVNLISDSTHVRILAFSDVDIDEVKISFDKKNWVTCTATKIPLYVCKWQPNVFTSGLHTLYVSAKDILERKLDIEHLFSIDGTGVGFKTMPRILLMLDAPSVFQATFATLLLINVLPLIILRMRKEPPAYVRNSKLFRSLWLLSKIDRIFYPIVLYEIYLPLGPWAIGEFIDGHIGIIFAWGILIKSTLLPEPFTYMYGGVQLLFVHIPLKLVLASCLQKRLFIYPARGLRKLISNLPFVFLLSIQMLFAYFFWLEYGTLGLIFGPLRTWSIPLSILLWYRTLLLPPEYCRKLIKLNEGPA